MTSPYNEFRYIIPPRTEIERGPEAIPRFQRSGWLAQYKRNGSRSIIFVPPDRKPFVRHIGMRRGAAWNRHGEPHRTWAFNEETWEVFSRIPGHNWYVLDGELLHHKTKQIKHTHYLYDLIVDDGIHLTSTTYSERYERLCDLFPIIGDTSGNFIVDQFTWIAHSYSEDLAGVFAALNAKEDEGIVLKDPAGIYRTHNANAWMAKILRPIKK